MRDVTEAQVASIISKNGVKGDVYAWTALANRVLSGWESLHGAKFPDGQQPREHVGHRLAISVQAEWESIGGDEAFKGRRRSTSRRTLSILAKCLGLPLHWRNSDSQTCRNRRRAHWHVTDAGTMFDPTALRYAVYADVLTIEQIQNTRGLPARAQATST